MKKEGYRRKTTLEKRNRVIRVMGRPVGSTGFGRVVAPADLLANPDRSSH
jgi:hypothetical protein